jgi:hypothetical protein
VPLPQLWAAFALKGCHKTSLCVVCLLIAPFTWTSSNIFFSTCSSCSIPQVFVALPPASEHPPDASRRRISSRTICCVRASRAALASRSPTRPKLKAWLSVGKFLHSTIARSDLYLHSMLGARLFTRRRDPQRSAACTRLPRPCHRTEESYSDPQTTMAHALATLTFVLAGEQDSSRFGLLYTTCASNHGRNSHRSTSSAYQWGYLRAVESKRWRHKSLGGLLHAVSCKWSDYMRSESSSGRRRARVLDRKTTTDRLMRKRRRGGRSGMK